jgi:ribosomal protein S25
MFVNLLAHIEATFQQQSRYLLSEFLTDVARIHHESARIDHALYLEAVEEISRLRIVSVDFLRRQMKITYPQAMRLIQQMEDEGIIRRTDYRSGDSRQGWRYEVI